VQSSVHAKQILLDEDIDFAARGLKGDIATYKVRIKNSLQMVIPMLLCIVFVSLYLQMAPGARVPLTILEIILLNV